jgi:hypothetical protein
MPRIFVMVFFVGFLSLWGCSSDKSDTDDKDAGQDAGHDAENGDPGPGDPGPGDPGPGDPGPGDAGDGGCTSQETNCSDGRDDDCDGRTDCDDTDCAISACGLTLVGGIHISKVVPDHGSWTGSCIYTGHQIYDSPNPGEIFAVTHHSRWFKAFEDGNCYFLAELIPGFCTPACSASEWCTSDDYCETLPVPRHAGTLTITGLPVGTKTISPDSNGEYHHSFQEACFGVDQSFTSASTVTLTASGGPTPAFSLTVPGVDWILPPLNCDPNLPPPDQDYVFTWTPANDGSWIRLYLPTWHHAGMGSAVICEVPDSTGVLTVSATMVNYYLANGAVTNRTYGLARLQRAVLDVGGGHGVGLEVMADRACDFFH